MGCKSTTNKQHAIVADEKPSKDIVKVTFKYNGREEGSEEHNLDDKLIAIIQEKLKGKVDLSQNGKYNLADIERELLASKDASIRTILNSEDNKSGHTAVLKEENGKVVIQIFLHGLQHLAVNFEEAYNKTNIIAKPLAEDEQKVAIFDESTNKIVFEKLALPDGEKLFTDSSAYCNGNNRLYISGGQVNKNVIDTIYEFDLVTKEVHVPNTKLSQPRHLHSMIYVPNNYVFIVGGPHTKKVEYYNTVKKEVFPHSELQEERIEPTLVVVNNTYLYAFTRFFYRDDVEDTFEKINLRSNQKEWEKFRPKFDFEVTGHIFTHNYFGVSYHTPGHLIFIGGDGINEEDKCYVYEHENDTIKNSEVANQQLEFGEKFFYPLKQGNNFMIPNFELEKVNILRYVAGQGITPIEFKDDA
jgi:hypothetical protein